MGQLGWSSVEYGEAYTGTKSKDGHSQGGPAAPRAMLSEDERMSSDKPFGITKRMVLDAYLHVKANQGAAGIDEESLKMFEANLSGNLYKLWNRMASGSYLPSAVKRVEIEKKTGGVRVLGIPTVSDRIAQQVVKARIEAVLDPIFDPDSYAYRPNKSAQEAVEVTRQRCWKYDWVVEFDVEKAFDELDHGLLDKAVRKHVREPWALLYIERWMKAPGVTSEGTIVPRDKGVSQGGVVSPLLMNLFMHYAFDRWMRMRFAHLPFARFADDAVVHCRSESEAQEVLAAIDERLRACKLRIHPLKSAVVYCKDSNRRQEYPRVQFTFLGFTFRPRSAKDRLGKRFTSFLPAVSREALRRMMRQMREWKVHRMTWTNLQDLALRYNPILRGWLNYYGSFYRNAMRWLFYQFDQKLARWARRKYKKLRLYRRRSFKWLAKVARRRPRMFDHWLVFGTLKGRTMGAV
jgi:group II intron reverse transcriptase/maturase